MRIDPPEWPNTAMLPGRASRLAQAFKMTLMKARLIFLALLIPTASMTAPAEQASVGSALPQWTPGMLDVHQLATGRGNAAFLILPDGTTMLVDAGDVGDVPGLPARPDGSRTAAQSIARYVRHVQGERRAQLNYAVLTHFHPDHIGGIASLAAEVPIETIIDRGDAYLKPPDDDRTYAAYRGFITANPGIARLTAEAGSASQIVLRDKVNAPFEARVLSVNDRVWTGEGRESRVRFPALRTITVPDDRPTENMCSVTLRIKYGAFDFFTGGDQPGYPNPGNPSWHDVETDVAKAIGATDVHVVNHHGSIEVENLFWLRTLASRVMVVPAWSTTHPSPDVLKRMLARRVYDKPRDIFVTRLHPETKAAIGPRAEQVGSDDGHVVVRVEPGGARFWVFVLDDSAETYPIRMIHGPYQAE